MRNARLASDSRGNTGSGTRTVGINAPVTTTQSLEASNTFDPTTHDIMANTICGSGWVAPTSVRVTNTTQGNGRVSVTESGLWLLELVTSNGALTINHFETA